MLYLMGWLLLMLGFCFSWFLLGIDVTDGACFLFRWLWFVLSDCRSLLGFGFYLVVWIGLSLCYCWFGFEYLYCVDWKLYLLWFDLRRVGLLSFVLWVFFICLGWLFCFAFSLWGLWLFWCWFGAFCYVFGLVWVIVGWGFGVLVLLVWGFTW